MSWNTEEDIFDEEHRLKPLDKLFSELEMTHGRLDRSHAFRCRGWTINSLMQVRFGDGEFYGFTKVDSFTDSSYTHRSDDGYYYHEAWFESSDVDVPMLDKLDEKDFIL